MPPGKPNTELAIRHGAAALAADPEAGRRLVRLLYRALWHDCADLSRPDVLDALAAEAGLAPLSPTETAAAQAARWQRAWASTGVTGVPLIVREDGSPLYGLAQPEALRELLS